MPSMPRTVFTPAGPIDPGMRTLSTPSMPAVASGEIRRSLSFRVPSAPAFQPSSGSSPKHVAVAPTFGPADLGAAAIAHRAQQVDTEDAFTLLGLPDGASVEAARAAYFRLAKLWHPDRLPQDLAPFAMEVEKIFDYMTRAHRTLTEVELRREYVAKGPKARLAAGASGSAPPAEKRPRAEVLREIEQALTKRDFEFAETTARELSKADADDADAQALAAWASTFAGEAPEETLRAAVTLLDRAVSRDRDCERAHYFRGLLHKRLGGNASAFRDFTRVVQLNPKHLEAQREVRIFEMRARKGSGEHALDALISKSKKK
jgi:curved DNA-binding protein CbpA